MSTVPIQPWIAPEPREDFTRTARRSGRTISQAAGEAFAQWIEHMRLAEALAAVRLAEQVADATRPTRQEEEIALR